MTNKEGDEQTNIHQINGQKDKQKDKIHRQKNRGNPQNNTTTIFLT